MLSTGTRSRPDGRRRTASSIREAPHRRVHARRPRWARRPRARRRAERLSRDEPLDRKDEDGRRARVAQRREQRPNVVGGDSGVNRDLPRIGQVRAPSARPCRGERRRIAGNVSDVAFIITYRRRRAATTPESMSSSALHEIVLLGNAARARSGPPRTRAALRSGAIRSRSPSSRSRRDRRSRRRDRGAASPRPTRRRVRAPPRCRAPPGAGASSSDRPSQPGGRPAGRCRRSGVVGNGRLQGATREPELGEGHHVRLGLDDEIRARYPEVDDTVLDVLRDVARSHEQKVDGGIRAGHHQRSLGDLEREPRVGTEPQRRVGHSALRRHGERQPAVLPARVKALIAAPVRVRSCIRPSRASPTGPRA